MTHDEYIPLGERQRLRDKMLKKHNLANILTHWFNVAMWALLLPTGLAILSSPRIGLVPEMWQTLMRNLFGGAANLIKFHYTIGLLWLAVLTFNITLGFRKYFLPFSRERLLLDRDDVEWLKVKPLQMVGLARNKALPPQDVYNAGQKLYMYAVMVGTFVIGLTGLIMTFHRYLPWPWLMQWSLPLHFTAVGMVVAGLIIHVYMGAVFPEEKEAFFSMFTGKVSAWYARRHHAKWYWRKALEEAEWEERVLAEGRRQNLPHTEPEPAAPAEAG
jgi:formate dehydrogenase subunit gamma